MGLYARRRGLFVAQLLVDIFVVAWCVIWGAVGNRLHAVIEALNAPLQDSSEAATRLREQFRTAGDEASRVPGVGADLRRPFDGAAEQLAGIITSAQDQMQAISRVADLVGWLAFLIPALIVIAFWLPPRIRFFRVSRAAQGYIDGSADLQLFALRAMANQPMHVLARISDDPVADWQRGDQDVVNRLAEVELRRAGLRMPEEAS